MKVITDQQVYQMLTPSVCIDLMEELFLALHHQQAQNPLRMALPIAQQKLMGIMPGLLSYKQVSGAKLITVFHENYKKGLPSHQGIVSVFSNQDGTPLGIADGGAITAVRTGAVSALATKYLADPDAKIMAILGAGVQAQWHLKSIACVRKLQAVNIWSIKPEETQKFIEQYSKEYPDIAFIGFESARQAVLHADIICTVTASHTPVLQGEWVKPGAHINAVGACKADERELDSICVAKAKMICDSVVSCENEAGDYLIPLKEGVIKPNHLLGTLSQVVSGQLQVRSKPQDITIFEAQGLAVEDIACAAWLLK